GSPAQQEGENEKTPLALLLNHRARLADYALHGIVSSFRRDLLPSMVWVARNWELVEMNGEHSAERRAENDQNAYFLQTRRTNLVNRASRRDISAETPDSGKDHADELSERRCNQGQGGPRVSFGQRIRAL